MNLLKLNETLFQKPPFQMVDKVLELEEKKYVRALKNLTMNESFFQGHFPRHPILPGVLMIEALAQASSLIVGQTDKLPVLVKVDEMKFLRPGLPGDSIVLESWIESNLPEFCKFRVQSSIEGKVAAQGRLSFSLVDVEVLFGSE